MGVGGQCHAAAALPQGKTRYSLYFTSSPHHILFHLVTDFVRYQLCTDVVTLHKMCKVEVFVFICTHKTV